MPDGVYYIALWLDPNGFLAESNEINNASLSWGTIGIGQTGLSAAAAPGVAAMTALGSPIAGEAYNGKMIPAREGSVRQVRITTTANGRRMESLDGGPATPARACRQRRRRAGRRSPARAQQVIFPIAEMKPMP